MTQRHVKQKIKDFIETNDNPQNWRLYKVINDENIKLKRLLNDMVRENLITIHYENEGKKVKRIIKNKMNVE